MQSVDDTLALLRARLVDYLHSQGRIVGNDDIFRCIVPGHTDNHPSAHIVPHTGRERWYCHAGCAQGGDIFDAAHYLEGMPLQGHEFLSVTVATLCNRFGIPFELPDLTDKQRRALRIRRTLTEAAGVLVERGSHTYGVKERGWRPEICAYMGCASIDYATLTHELSRKMFTSDDLAEADIVEALFGMDKFTFTLHDPFGRPVGFAARNLDPERKPKYRNTSNIDEIFNKSSFIYNLHLAKQQRTLILVEGYADVLACVERGVYNVAAVCGTSFTEGQVDLLRAHGVAHVVLAFDYDQNGAGQKGMSKALDLLAGTPNLSVSVWDLKQYLQEGLTKVDLDYLAGAVPSLPALLAEEPWESAFKWRLKEFPRGTPADEICKKALGLVINEPFRPTREIMLRDLADFTDVPIKALREELDSMTYIETAEYREAKEKIRQQVVSRLRNSAIGLEDVINAAYLDLSGLQDNATTNDDLYSEAETLEFCNTFKEGCENGTMGFTGYTTGWPGLDLATNGVPRQGKMLAFGGNPNVGKSGLMIHLAWNLLVHNWNDDVMVLYFATDDSRHDILLKMLALETGIPINSVSRPALLQGPARDKLEHNWAILKYHVEHGSLGIKDTSHGSSLSFLEKWIDRMRESHPDKSPIVFIDSFHKMTGSGESERIIIKNMSQTIHRWARENRATFLCTMECSKGNERKIHPSYRDLLESGQMAYDADFIGMVWNELHERGTSANAANVWEDGTGEQKPIVVMDVQKNKLTAVKKQLVFRFDPDKCRFEEQVAPTGPWVTSPPPKAEEARWN